MYALLALVAIYAVWRYLNSGLHSRNPVRRSLSKRVLEGPEISVARRVASIPKKAVGGLLGRHSALSGSAEVTLFPLTLFIVNLSLPLTVCRGVLRGFLFVCCFFLFAAFRRLTVWGGEWGWSRCRIQQDDWWNVHWKG